MSVACREVSPAEHIWNPILGKGEVVGVSNNAAICHRMSPTLKSTGVGVTLGQNLGK